VYSVAGERGYLRGAAPAGPINGGLGAMVFIGSAELERLSTLGYGIGGCLFDGGLAGSAPGGRIRVLDPRHWPSSHVSDTAWTLVTAGRLALLPQVACC